MQPVNRREFLSGVLGAAAGLGVRTGKQARAADQTDQSTEVIPKPCPPSAWTKHGLVLESTEQWEGVSVESILNRAEPLDGDRWRIWYASGEAIAYAEGVPGEKMRKIPAVLSPGEPADARFSIGGLPADCKPLPATYLRLRNGTHRLYLWVIAPGILRCLAADSSDGRRYRVKDFHRPVFYHFKDRAAQGVLSFPDGTTYVSEHSPDRPADEPLAPPHLIVNDVTNVYQLEDGTFEVFATGIIRVPENHFRYNPDDNTIGALRVIDRFVSEDGLRFENRKRAIEWDADDPVDQQFYYLAVTHTPRGRVGMLGHYRSYAQTMDLEWCFSADGWKWHRQYRRAWINRGNRNEPDSYGIYANNAIVHHRGRYHLFYTAGNCAHNGKHSFGSPRAVIMHASTASIWA